MGIYHSRKTAGKEDCWELLAYICIMEITYTLAEIGAAALKLWQRTGPGKVLAFHGPMGAGKTTLIHALCDQLRVQGTVGSPTFSLINEYGSGQGRIYHLDLYRIASEEEALRAGVEETLYSGHTCLVEWPEKAPGLLPDGSCHIYLEVIDNLTRKLRIDGN